MWSSGSKEVNLHASANRLIFAIVNTRQPEEYNHVITNSVSVCRTNKTECYCRPTQHSLGLMCIHQCPHELPFIQVVVNHLIVMDQQPPVQCRIRCCIIMTIVKALVISTFIAWQDPRADSMRQILCSD